MAPIVGTGHYWPSPTIYNRELYVTDEGIYGGAEPVFEASLHQDTWMRIDRADNRIGVFSFQHSSLDERPIKGSIRIRGDRLIYAADKGIVCYSLRNQIKRLLPLPKPTTQVQFLDDGYIAANKTSLFQLDGKGSIVREIPFPKPLSGDPRTMEVDEGILWLGSDGQLNRYDLRTGVQQTYSIGVVKIIPDDECVWIFGWPIWRYEKRKGEMVCIGSIVLDDKPFSKSSFSYHLRDATKATDRIYMAGDGGLLELDGKNLSLKVSEMTPFPYSNPFNPLQICRHGEYYYISVGNEILQIDASRFEKGFKKSERIGWWNDDRGGANLLPFGKEIVIGSDAQKNLIYFDLSDQLTPYGHDNPGLENLSGTLGGHAIKLVLASSSGTYYYAILTKELLGKTAFPASIEIWDIRDKSRKRLGQWTLRLKE